MDRIKLVASCGRMGRGAVVAVSETQATVSTAFEAQVGDILFLTGIFDTVLVKIACKVVAQGRDGLELALIAMTRESQAALRRYVQVRAREGARPAGHLQPKFRTLPGLAARVHKPWTPVLRRTDRHGSASERWLERR